MPFNPFNNLTGKKACTLFEIRLDDDFIIFRGNEHEAAGQLLKGTLVLCLPSALKMEDIHLRLTGHLRLAWMDSRSTPTGITTHKVDRTRMIVNHKWNPFISAPPGSSSKSMTLKPGNYEWPFELLLPGDTAESVEGLPETGLTYKLKATIARGKLAYDIHAYKHVRIVRTLEPAALEFLHAMSVENVWVNKIEYSIVIPQKAIVFGGTVPLDMRFTPLLKGLEMGDITVRLVEIQEFVVHGPFGPMNKEHRHERDIEKWVFKVNQDEHWRDVIEETEQEGWVVHAPLSLPKKLRECVQDVNARGIKIRHKLRLTVAMKNPDGHVSELRATLPITVFISPNMLLDDQGNIVRQQPGVVSDLDAAAIAPPGYGEHILDQLYDDLPMTGFQSPPSQSGANSPFYALSRDGSVDNLAIMSGACNGVAPAALSSRLQDMTAVNGTSGMSPRSSFIDRSNQNCSGRSGELSRRTSTGDDDASDREHASGHLTPEHVDFPALQDLSRVPSYSTAVQTPARHLHVPTGNAPPTYVAAVSRSASPSPNRQDSDPMNNSGAVMETIHEAASTHSFGSWTSRRRRRRGSGSSSGSGGSAPGPIRGHAEPSENLSAGSESPRVSIIAGRARVATLGLSFLHSHMHVGDSDERGQVRLLQVRGG